jgi:anthranilate phosphoribosyltransferase
MIKEAIIKLSRREDLTLSGAETVMNEIMDGQTTQVQTAAYLTALSLKGETIDEITASAAGMRAHCVKLLHEMDVLRSGAPAATAPIPSTSPPPPPWSSPPAACPWPSTATRPPPQERRPPTCGGPGVKTHAAPRAGGGVLQSLGICFLYAHN